MNFFGLFFLLITHFITGRGILELFKVRFSFFKLIPFSMLIGVATFALMPFALGLAKLPITRSSLTIFIFIVTALSSISLLKYLKNMKAPDFKNFKLPAIYELPFFVVFAFLLTISVWRCFLYPTNPRDMLSGPEPIAEYAVKEGTLINSVYSVDLTTTNNHLKPLWVTSLQILYKIFVQPFGQLWLSVIVISFLTLAITLLKEKLHPLIALFIMVYFLGMPEVFGYTYLVLFDYSNMIYFFCGFYFLAQYLMAPETKNYFLLSVLFFAFSTYIRSETLILIGMIVPLLLFYMFKITKDVKQIAIKTALFLFFPFLVYYLSIGIFDRYYIPQHYDVGTEINKNIKDVSIFFGILGDMSSKLIFAESGSYYYGYFIELFLLIVAIDLVFFRKNSSREKIVALYGVCLVYVGLAFLSYVFPLVDLAHTIKRGLFKMFPLMFLYFRSSGVLLKLSEIITNWEYGTNGNNPKPIGVKTTPTPQTVKPPIPPTPPAKKK